MKRKVFRMTWVGAVMLALVLLAVACGATEEPTQPPPEPVATQEPEEVHEEGDYFPPELPSAARGEAIYTANCASCHGLEGDGSAFPGAANFRNVDFMRHEKPAEFFEAISEGVAGTAMPAWEGVLSEMEIWDVLYYEWTFATRPEEVAKGQELFAANCVSCHGEAGDGSGLPGAADFTDLRFMSNEYPAEFFEVISEGVAGTAMPGWDGTFTEGEIWALVDFIWTFSYDYSQ